MSALDSLRSRIKQKALDVMQETEAKALSATQDNLYGFYSIAGTGRYKRTGQLGESAKSSGISIDGNCYENHIYLDIENVVYKVPNPAFNPPYASYFTPQEVFSAAEEGKAHIAGKPGFWAKSEKEIEDIFYDSIRRHFNT